MPTYSIFYEGGPCSGRTAERFFQTPPATLTCGGHVYEWIVAAPGVTRLTYVAQGSAFDVTPEQVRGERDVLRSWHRLMHELAHGTIRTRRSLRAAGSRVRRAVR